MRGPLAKELHARSSLHRVTAGDVETAEIEGSRLQGRRVLPLKSLLQKGTQFGVTEVSGTYNIIAKSKQDKKC